MKDNAAASNIRTAAVRTLERLIARCGTKSFFVASVVFSSGYRVGTKQEKGLTVLSVSPCNLMVELDRIELTAS